MFTRSRTNTTRRQADRTTQPDTAERFPGLRMEGVTKRYANADHDVLHDISLDVPRGKVLVVVGPSGSGKSTLLRAVAGLEPIQGGEILLNGDIIGQGRPGTKAAGYAPRPAALRTRIGMVFQSYDLFPNRNVLDNVTMAPVLVLKRDKRNVEQEALRLLERVGLRDRADAKPHELSGGQRQRVAICRAMIMHPELLLLDEITASLDPEMVREVLDVVLDLADGGQTMMIVTHEMAFARAVADEVVMLENGGIVERSDNPEQFFTHPRTRRAQEFLETFEFARRHRG